MKKFCKSFSVGTVVCPSSDFWARIRSRYQLFVFRETVVNGSLSPIVIDVTLQHEGSFVKRRKQCKALVFELQQLAVPPCTLLDHDFDSSLFWFAHLAPPVSAIDSRSLSSSWSSGVATIGFFA